MTHNTNPAPIVFIAFNRPQHTQQCLAALAQNPLAINSDLFIFIDGPRNPAEQQQVQQVIKVCEQTTGFKSINIHHHEKNLGAAINVPQAVSTVINRFGRVIVIEDDVLVSKAFLQYMNDALAYYETEKKVWHIAGHNDPKVLPYKPDKSYFTPFMRGWGWATWKDRWQHYQRNPADLMQKFDKAMIRRFNSYNPVDWWDFVKWDVMGKVNAWDVYWYAVIFLHQGLCLNPYYSFTRNIGHDGSGTHSSFSLKYNLQQINDDGVFVPPAKIAIDKQVEKIFAKRRLIYQYPYKIKKTLEALFPFLPVRKVYQVLKRIYYSFWALFQKQPTKKH